MKDFDKWNKLKKDIDLKPTNNFVRVGELWWCNLGLNIGSEQDGGGILYERPVVVIRRYSPTTFLGLPVTSKKKNGAYFLPLDENNIVILSQPRLLDTKRICRLIKLLPKKQMREIIKKFKELI